MNVGDFRPNGFFIQSFFYWKKLIGNSQNNIYSKYLHTSEQHLITINWPLSVSKCEEGMICIIWGIPSKKKEANHDDLL